MFSSFSFMLHKGRNNLKNYYEETKEKTKPKKIVNIFIHNQPSSLTMLQRTSKLPNTEILIQLIFIHNAFFKR